MSSPHTKNRRDFLFDTASAAAAASLATVLPARVLGRDGSAPPSETITLGVIGIGPRCTYVLNAMLQHEDIQCIAIADVQAQRRDDGKAHG